jgi:hypothetical protein
LLRGRGYLDLRKRKYQEDGEADRIGSFIIISTLHTVIKIL